MNRAKRFCTELSKNSRIGTLTGFLEEEVLKTRKTISETNQIKGFKSNEGGMPCSRKGNLQEQVIEINMKQYLTALNRYSNELLPGSYEFFKPNKK